MDRESIKRQLHRIPTAWRKHEEDGTGVKGVNGEKKIRTTR